MRKYLTYFTTVFRDTWVYKADYFFTIIFNIIFFIIYYSIWTLIYKSQGLIDIMDYSLANIITYYFITTFLYRLDITDELFLGEFIWNGIFTNDLIRPVNARIVYILDALAQVLVKVILFLPVGLLIYFFARNYIIFPNTEYFLLFVVSAILGMLLNISFFLIINSFAFHFGDQGANIDLFDFLSKFFAGAVFPLVFLPPSIYWLFNYLPFKFIYFVPAEIFLQKLSVSEVIHSFVSVTAWIIIFYLIFLLIYKKGLYKYSGIGR